MANSNLTEPGSERASKGLCRPIFWLCVGGLIAADLTSKAWVFSTIGIGGGVHPVLGEWLSLYCLTNDGGIWGLGGGGGFTAILTVVRLLAVGILVWFVRRQADGNRIGIFTLALLIAGAIGNLYDNLSRWMPWDLDDPGKVRDFVMVSFPVPGWWPGFLGWPFEPFPIFNFADACISVGFVLLITGVARLQFRDESEAGRD